MRTACSKIWENALGVTRRSAIKYPRRHEVIPIKGNAKGRILIAVAHLASPRREKAMKSAPKKSIIIEIKAIIRVKDMLRCKIRSGEILRKRTGAADNSGVRQLNKHYEQPFYVQSLSNRVG